MRLAVRRCLWLLSVCLLPATFNFAAAQTCTISGGSVTLNGGACTIPPGTVLKPSSTGITANNGQVTADGVTINPATNGGSTGLIASGSSGRITGALTINMNGFGGTTAVKATAGSTISLSSGSAVTIPPFGGGTTGLWATGAGSQVVASDTTVTMSGLGGGDFGLRADTGGFLSAANTTVTLSGGGDSGGLLNNGTMQLTGGSVSSTGSGGVGFLFQGSPDSLTLSGTTVTASADAFRAQGGVTNITATDATITGGVNVLNAFSGAAVTLVSTNSVLTGAAQTDGSSNSTMTLNSGTVWNMTGNSTVTNLTNSNSTINFLPPTGDPTQLGSYKTLTVTNYTGSGSGTIILNTYLGADGSPSDKLVVSGGTADPSFLTIHNTTGPGAITSGNGIQVVQAINGGTTVPDAFQLSGSVITGAPAVLAAGPFEYLLFRGGLNGTNPDDWFLRSSFVVPPNPIMPPIDGGGGSDTDPFPPNPPLDPANLPPGTYPLVGPRLATYGVVQPMARQLGLTTLGTLQERIGDTLSLGNAGAGNGGWFSSAWGRFIGQQVDNRYQAFADPSAKGQLLGMQTGIDVWRGNFLPGHNDTAGVYFAYLNGNADVDGLVTNSTFTGYQLTQTGTVNLDSYSFGGYWTHYGPGGWYLDGVLQGTRYTGDANAPFTTLGLSTQLPTNGTGFVSSLEGGYPVPLPLGPGFNLEPQAQLIWQHVSFGQANDGLADVSLGSSSGTTGRLGLRGQWTIPGENGAIWQPYGRFNFWHDWGGAAATNFSASGIQVPLLEHTSRLEFAGGLTFKLNTNLSFYAQAGYQFADGPGNSRRDGVKGDIGLRYSW